MRKKITVLLAFTPLILCAFKSFENNKNLNKDYSLNANITINSAEADKFILGTSFPTTVIRLLEAKSLSLPTDVDQTVEKVIRQYEMESPELLEAAYNKTD